MFGSSFEADMAASSGKGISNVLEINPPSIPSIADIQTRKDTGINQPVHTGSKTKTEKVDKLNCPIRNSTTSAQKHMMRPIPFKNARKQSQTQRSQKTWAVQPTEPPASTRPPYLHSKNRVGQKPITQTRTTCNKSVTQTHQRQPKEGNIPRQSNTADETLSYSRRYKTSQRESGCQILTIAKTEHLTKEPKLDIPLNVPNNELSGQTRGQKKIFHLNAETMKEIESLGTEHINYSNIKSVINSETPIARENLYPAKIYH